MLDIKTLVLGISDLDGAVAQLSGALQTSDGETSQPDLALEDIGCMCGEGNGSPLQYSCLENPWTEEPGGLQCKVMPNVDPWRRQRHPTPVLFLPGESMDRGAWWAAG